MRLVIVHYYTNNIPKDIRTRMMPIVVDFEGGTMEPFDSMEKNVAIAVSFTLSILHSLRLKVFLISS